MPITITISDQARQELLALAEPATPPPLSTVVKQELVKLLGTVTATSTVTPVTPITQTVGPTLSGNWKTDAINAAKAAGFDNAIVVDWDWNSPIRLGPLDTAWMQGNKQVGIGLNGILIVRFVPTLPEDSIVSEFAATGYPAAQMLCQRRLTISEKPADMFPTDKLAKTLGETPVLRYCIGPPKTFVFGRPTSVGLTAGKTYYINIANRDQDNNKTAVDTEMYYPHCDFRLSINKPH